MARILLIDAGSFTSLLNWHEKKPAYRIMCDIRNILEETRADKTFLCCDFGQSKFRTTKFPDYKKARKERREQQPESEKRRADAFFKDVNKFINTIAPLLGIEVLKHYEIEADDLVSYCCQAINTTKEDDKYKNEVLILSNDHDILQLIRPGIIMRSYSHKQNFGPDDFKIPQKTWVGAKVFKESYEFAPEQLPHALAFSEDSDGLKTPYGLGKKFAIELIRKYGTIDGVKDNLHRIKTDIKGFRKSALDDLNKDFDNIYFNFDLVNLHYTPEIKAEIFDEKTTQALDSKLAQIDQPNSLDEEAIKDYFYEIGAVNRVVEFDKFIKPFWGV